MLNTDFFKILNNKINACDKIAGNPFDNKKLIVIWVEDVTDKKFNNEKSNN